MSKIYEEERMMSLAEVAVGLRRLADQVEAGAVSYGSGESLSLPDKVEWELEVERKSDLKSGRTKHEIEIELEWYA